MKSIQKYLVYFLGLLTILIVFDYIESGAFKWIENAVQSIFVTLFYMFLNWCWDSKEYKKKES